MINRSSLYNLEEKGKGRSWTTAERKAQSRTMKKQKFKISARMKKPGVQRKMALSRKKNLSKGVVKVGGKLVRKSLAQRLRAIKLKKQKAAGTGIFSSEMLPRRAFYNTLVERFQSYNLW